MAFHPLWGPMQTIPPCFSTPLDLNLPSPLLPPGAPFCSPDGWAATITGPLHLLFLLLAAYLPKAPTLPPQRTSLTRSQHRTSGGKNTPASRTAGLRVKTLTVGRPNTYQGCACLARHHHGLRVHHGVPSCSDPHAWHQQRIAKGALSVTKGATEPDRASTGSWESFGRQRSWGSERQGLWIPGQVRGCCQQSRAAGAQETDDPTLYILKTKLSVKRSQPQPQRTPFLNAKPPPKIKIKKANELVSLFLLSGGFTLGAGDAPPGLSGRGRSLVRGPPG